MSQAQQFPLLSALNIELFSCAGGMAEGFRRAGIEFDFAFDFAPDHCTSYETNIGHRPVCSDVRDILRLARAGLFGGRAIDLFVADPPCFPAGTLVTTSDGDVPIEQVSEGDEVLTHVGRYRPVKRALRKTYIGTMYAIQCGYRPEPVRATAEHPFFVRRADQMLWVAAQDLLIGDMLLVPSIKEPIGTSDLRVRTRRIVRDSGNGKGGSQIVSHPELVEAACRIDVTRTEVAWLLGLYLAEGHRRGREPSLHTPGLTRREVIFSVANHEVPDVEQRASALGEHLIVSQHGDSVRRVVINSPDWWALCGLFGDGAESKRIPSWIYGMGSEWRSALLDGYVFGDGHSRANSGGGAIIETTTISRQLAGDVSRLVASVEQVVPSLQRGRRAGMTVIEGRRVTTQDTWRVRWSPATHYKRSGVVNLWGAWVPIESISATEMSLDVFNLSVTDDESYCADDIAVHNCTPWSRAGLRKGTDDERDMLEETCELIRLLRPRAYLIGNVPGLDDSKNWHIVQKVIGGLSKYGYCTADFAALDAVNYGVPQHRVRPFWFGHLDGPCIQWPAPTHCDPTLLSTLVLPGIEALKPWITCRQALGHLPPEELGRPVRLRRRACNSKQHGSVHDKPARVVGTSNLSDGNVLLSDSTKHPVLELDAPSTTVRGGGEGHAAPALVLLSERHPPAELDRPSPAVTAKPRGPGGQLKRTSSKPKRTSRERAPFEGGYTPSELDAPAKAVVKNTHGNGAVLKYDVHHPPHDVDKPANVIRAGDGQGGNRAMRTRDAVIVEDPKHPVHDPDAPANLIRASDGGGSGSVLRTSGTSAPPAPKKARRKRDEGRPGQGMRVGKADVPGKTVTAKASRVGAGESHVIEWPWDRPATVVAADDRLAPPGHHDENWDGGTRSVEGAVVLSEKAAAILQGFPESWCFVGKTKKIRWSQIGQAMPPPLSHAVARSVAAQRKATRELEASKDLSASSPSLATGKLTVV